jgi:hypothetical protein
MIATRGAYRDAGNPSDLVSWAFTSPTRLR